MPPRDPTGSDLSVPKTALARFAEADLGALPLLADDAAILVADEGLFHAASPVFNEAEFFHQSMGYQSAVVARLASNVVLATDELKTVTVPAALANYQGAEATMARAMSAVWPGLDAVADPATAALAVEVRPTTAAPDVVVPPPPPTPAATAWPAPSPDGAAFEFVLAAVSPLRAQDIETVSGRWQTASADLTLAEGQLRAAAEDTLAGAGDAVPWTYEAADAFRVLTDEATQTIATWAGSVALRGDALLDTAGTVQAGVDRMTELAAAREAELTALAAALVGAVEQLAVALPGTDQAIAATERVTALIEETTQTILRYEVAALELAEELAGAFLNGAQWTPAGEVPAPFEPTEAALADPGELAGLGAAGDAAGAIDAAVGTGPGGAETGTFVDTSPGALAALGPGGGAGAFATGVSPAGSPALQALWQQVAAARVAVAGLTGTAFAPMAPTGGGFLPLVPVGTMAGRSREGALVSLPGRASLGSTDDRSVPAADVLLGSAGQWAALEPSMDPRLGAGIVAPVGQPVELGPQSATTMTGTTDNGVLSSRAGTGLSGPGAGGTGSGMPPMVPPMAGALGSGEETLGGRPRPRFDNPAPAEFAAPPPPIADAAGTGDAGPHRVQPVDPRTRAA